jgi:hypothetical protein
MQAHRKKAPLTESFLIHIVMELEAAGLQHPLYKEDPGISKAKEALFVEGERCPPVFPARSRTQPTFHELQERSASPNTVTSSNVSNTTPSRSTDSRAPSPQYVYQSSFAVTGIHDPPQKTRPNAPSPNPPIVPSQSWDQQPFVSTPGTGSMFSTATPAGPMHHIGNLSQRPHLDSQQQQHESSHANYPTQAQNHETTTAGAPTASGLGQDPFSFHKAAPYAAFQPPANFSQAPPADVAFSLQEDWDMQNAMGPQDWDLQLSWEDAAAMGAGLAPWRTGMPGANQGGGGSEAGF